MVWKKNMTVKGEPEIEPYKEKDFTKITFYPDFPRFHMENGFDTDIVAFLSKRAYDMAGILPGVKVTLNGKEIMCNTFDKYIQMYFEEGNKIPRIKDK